MKQGTTQFDFAARPKVTVLKQKYRERDQDRLEGTNLMNDPRVVRGNTHTAIANITQIQPPPLKKSLKDSKRRIIKQKRINFDTGFEPTTPRAVDGRQHYTTQTQPFVQTLRDKPIQYTKQIQTDLFLDRPVQRQFNPMLQKVGVDEYTQVDEHDPQLFNFDYEVQPILEALLNRVIETSRMELYEQEQIRNKQKQKLQYEKKRHIKLAEAQKLQANQNRGYQEQERRQLQYRKSRQQQIFTQKRIISRILSKQYLRNLQQNTQIILQHQGLFRSPLQFDIFQQFVPWLYQQVLEELNQQEINKHFVQEILHQTQGQMTHSFNQFREKKEKERQTIRKQRQAEIQRKKEEKQRKLRQLQQKKRQQEEKLQKVQEPPVQGNQQIK